MTNGTDPSPKDTQRDDPDGLSDASHRPGPFTRMANWVQRTFHRSVWWFVRWALKIVLVFSLVCAVLVILFRFVNPPFNAYQMSEGYRLSGLKREWVPLEEFSPHMARAVVAAEDANFCTHWGFDVEAIREALQVGSKRGASTLSQQVAKNVFLWQGRSWIRKGLEVGFTLMIEATWPKARIVEVYLNVAEFDEGVFGASAGAQHYFGRAPYKITLKQAARLASVLPSPKKRSASKPTSGGRKRIGSIMAGAQTIAADGRSDCFESG